MNIALLPVRCGSKSIPFKNIKIFNGKPLLYWSLKSLVESQIFEEIHVATDCNKIKEVVNQQNFKNVKIFNRSEENAQDESSTESVMIEFLKNYNFKKEDVLFLVQATSPLVRSDDFINAYNLFSKNKYDSLLTCVRSKRFYWNDNNSPLNYEIENRPRRQDFRGLLMENGAFYISRIKNIIKSNNRLSGNIGIYEMDESTSIEIDEELDWIIAEKLLRKSINKKLNKEIKIFISDVDGTLTDAGMYYSEDGNELKKFNTHDGKGFELLRKSGIKTGIITSENTEIVKNRATKLKLDYIYQGLEHNQKLDAVIEICKKENVQIHNVAYIGDDINCKELLENVGLAACPSNSVDTIKSIENIHVLNKKGGEGAVREFIDFILS